MRENREYIPGYRLIHRLQINSRLMDIMQMNLINGFQLDKTDHFCLRF